MRIQHVSVMFVIIFIPIILVTSYFISLQVNTIKLESDYDEKLLNATYDAMTAFELNTANEDLSSVSDSLRSIIDASNNIFFNTLCTNLGISNASKSFVQPYIPAILYTLYDGYYIYSPTNIPEICVDDFGRTIRTSDYGVTYTKGNVKNGIGIYEFDKSSIVYSKYTPTEPAENPAVGDDNVQTASKVNYADLKGDSIEEEYGQILYKNNDGTYSTSLHSWTGTKDSEEYKKSTYYKRDYILKSYIPYSATYQTTGKDITVNYTLDNFMTIEGMIDGIYYTKSGYFIKNDLVKSINVDGVAITNWKSYSEELLDSYIKNPSAHSVSVELDDGSIISNQDGKVLVSNGEGSGSTTNYWQDSQSAVEYYVDSYIFSQWVYENLSGIQSKNLKNTEYSVTDIQNNIGKKLSVETDLQKNILYDFSADSENPFSSTNNNPESEESIFYEHKRNVIKNSITYNLILSMLVYTEESKTVEFNMPVLKETEWDRILNNVSIVSFMEGLKCGLKYYNNYAIVTSTNNEISVTDNEIYYVPRVLQQIDDTVENGGTNKWIISRLDDDETTYLNDRLLLKATPPENETAHRIDCEDLILGGNDNFCDSVWLGCHSFKSKEIKYDKILDSRWKICV